MSKSDATPATKADLQVFKEEIIHHFDLVLENIRHDLEGANRDEIEVLKDAKVDHGNRITKLEQAVGLRA